MILYQLLLYGVFLNDHISNNNLVILIRVIIALGCGTHMQWKGRPYPAFRTSLDLSHSTTEAHMPKGCKQQAQATHDVVHADFQALSYVVDPTHLCHSHGLTAWVMVWTATRNYKARCYFSIITKLTRASCKRMWTNSWFSDILVLMLKGVWYMNRLSQRLNKQKKKF